MNGYTPKQQEYINSVDGNAHMSAVEIIGELEERHTALVEAVAYHLELTDQHDMEYLGTQDKTTGLIGRVIAARAEVDRLIANETEPTE